MVFISHDLAVVESIADRVMVMRRGYLLEAGSRKQIFMETAHPYTRSLLGAVPTLHTDRQRPLAMVRRAFLRPPGQLMDCSPGHLVRDSSGA